MRILLHYTQTKDCVFSGLPAYQKLTENPSGAHCRATQGILLCAANQEGGAGAVKKSLWFVISVCSWSFLIACGGGGTPPAPPSPIVATHFSVTPSTSTPVSGVAFSVTVAAQGASGQAATDYFGTVHFSSSDSQAILPADAPVSSGSGIFPVTLKTAGNQTITVSDATSLTGTSGAITVGTAAPTHFLVTPAGNYATAGVAVMFSVTAMDVSGNAVTGYSGTVHFTSTDGAAVLPANSTLTSGTSNLSATLKTSGGQTISAMDTKQSAINGTSNVIYVSGPATHFSVANVAGSTAATRSQLTLFVAALDASNNVASGYSGTVRITSSDAKAILPANGPLPTGGTGAFTFTFETSGNQTITATDSTIAAVTGTSAPIAVTTSAPLAIASGNPPDGTVGLKYGLSKTTYEICSSIVGPGMGSCTPCVPNTVNCGPNLPTCAAGVFRSCIAKIVYQGFELTGTGGVPPYTWSGSSLPPGLAIKVQYPESLISGTPTAGSAATYNSVITLNDAGIPPAPINAMYAIVVNNPPPPAVTSALLFPGATVNQPFSYTFAATGGLPPYQNWKETGTLPATIAPLTSGGVLAGIPTMTGAFPITVTVEDSLGQVSPGQAFALRVYQHGFKTDGSMSTARTSHTTTLLPDGAVLIAGGLNLSSAEKYSPSTDTFTLAAGSMSVARAGHTATLLKNGKVLITGGQVNLSSAPTATAELFDPSTGMFTLTAGSMSVARTGHNATLLSNGTVLITGGGSTTAELFDPNTGKFTPTTGMLTTARFNDTATLLPNGKVLIAGGFDSTALATAELYDPATQTFSATGSMAETRVSHTATALTTGPNAGKVLVAGGSSTSAAELFDPTTGTFSSTGSMTAPRAGQTATVLGDGTVLMVGGSDADGIVTAAEFYDPNAGTFSGTGALQTAREAHAATLLNDGTVLVTGGVNEAGVLATAELYE